MKVFHSDKPAEISEVSIFLAGPTPRNKDVVSWRPEALDTLRQLGFEGSVLVPERQDWSLVDYVDQVEWEFVGLTDCTVIAFWVPREMTNMPALTTNVEFGFWMSQAPAKVIYGRPNNANSVRYLDWLYQKCTGKRPLNGMKEMLQAAINLAGAKTI